MTVRWEGYYQFNEVESQRRIGSDKTSFKIDIKSFDGKRFTGIVNDDTHSGGMEGDGKIIGEVNNLEIYFDKIIRSFTLLYKNGKRKTFNRKHPVMKYRHVIG